MKPGRIEVCRKVLILVVFALAGLGLAFEAGAQSSPAPGSLAWAKRAGGSNPDKGNSVAVRADGSTWVTGSFQGSATFGADESGQTTLTSAGNTDIFLAKYNPKGTLAWVRRVGGSGADNGNSVAVLADGSAWVTGRFYNTVTFGEGESGQVTLTSAGKSDTFLAKYHPDGTLAWARRDGGSNTDYDNIIFAGDVGNSVSVRADGSAWVTGYFGDSATFGVGESGQATLTGSGAFLAKYNPDGTLAWAKRAVSSGGATSVAVLNDGCAWVTGSYRDSVTFGPDGSGQTTLTSAGEGDIFIAKYNPDGTLAWVRSVGGSRNDYGYSVAVLADGSAWVTGSFDQTVTFGAGESGQAMLTSTGNDDMFLAKYNPNGTLAWVRSTGGDYTERGYSVAVRADGCAWVTGTFYGTVTFGAGESGQTILTSAGNYDVFLAKYNPNGTLDWARRAGGSGYDNGYSVAALADGSAWVTGVISGSATFGAGESGQTILTSAGDYDIFLAKFYDISPNRSLSVASAYGSPVPAVGMATYGDGETVTASVGSPVSGGPGVQYVCTGWTGSGSVPASGSGASVSFTLTQNSAITWQWKTMSDLLWVDFGYSGTELGTQNNPYKTLTGAFGVLLSGGTVVIKSGQTSDHPRIAAPMHLEAWGGPVRIGVTGQ